MSTDSTTLGVHTPSASTIVDGRSLRVTYRPGPGELCTICTVRVPVHTESVAAVRAEMGDDLSSRGLDDDLVEDAQIVVTELLTNSFRHARTL